MYANGHGVAPDMKESADWFLKAANLGDVQAQAKIADLYANGQGVEKDAVQAYKWSSLAAAGITELEARMKALSAIETLAKSMTPEQIARAKTLVSEWRKK
jgi:TPR repeat protein